MKAEVDQQLGRRRASAWTVGTAIAADTVLVVWTLGWERLYLIVSKVHQGGCISSFVTKRKRSEAALIQVVQEAFVQGVSTRKMEKSAQSLGVENLSKSQVSEMIKGLNDQVKKSRHPESFSGSSW